jgi:transposase InsO family protein
MSDTSHRDFLPSANEALRKAGAAEGRQEDDAVSAINTPRDLPAPAVKPCADRRLSHAQRPRGLAIGKAQKVNRDGGAESAGWSPVSNATQASARRRDSACSAQGAQLWMARVGACKARVPVLAG